MVNPPSDKYTRALEELYTRCQIPSDLLPKIDFWHGFTGVKKYDCIASVREYELSWLNRQFPSDQLDFTLSP